MDLQIVARWMAMGFGIGSGIFVLMSITLAVFPVGAV